MVDEQLGRPAPDQKRVLLLNLVFPPDGVSTAQILGEIALDVRAAGYDPIVVTSMPHYNRDLEAEAAQPVARRLWGLVGTSDFHGIPVHHVMVPGKSPRGAIRILQWMWFHVAAAIVGLRIRPRPDVIFATSPPLTMGFNAWLIGRLGRIPHVFNVWELYPDIAIQLGYMTNSTLIRGFRWLERQTYQRAASVTVTSDSMFDKIVSEGRAPHERVEVVPNFVDIDDFQPGTPVNAFSEQHGLSGKFVVSYAGNMGTPQGLDRILEAAAAMGDDSTIHYLLVGGGLEQPRLLAEASRLGLGNCTVLGHQPYSAVPDIYATSDLCLVPLSSGLEAEALPSKTFKIMAAGRPILALADPHSAVARLVDESGCGVVVASDRGSEIADVVRSLEQDRARLQAMGDAGRRYAQERFSRQGVVARYVRILDRLVGR